MHSLFRYTALGVVLGATALLSSACATSRVGRLDTATASVDQLRTQLTQGSARIDQVNESLRAFGETDDLESEFKEYTRELDRLEKAASQVRSRRAAMQARMADHVEKWQQDLADVQSEEIREVSAARQAQLVSALERLSVALDALKAEYQPYISNLRDIELLLANDLSVGGVAVAGPLIDDAISRGEDVKRTIETADDELDRAIAEFRR